MTTWQAITFTAREGVAFVTLNRPEKHNALAFDMWQALPGVVADAAACEDVKVIVLRGAGGRAFSAGADISEFQERRSDPESAALYNEAVEAAEASLLECVKPTIAMVQGLCIGGGLELAAACDLRIADEQARLGITAAKLGLVYGLGGTRRLVDLVGASQAKRLLFSADVVDASEALRIGLIDQLHSPADIEVKVIELAERIALRSQVSVQGSKAMVKYALEGRPQSDPEARHRAVEAVRSADYAEGVRAFLAGRAPRFGQAGE